MVGTLTNLFLWGIMAAAIAYAGSHLFFRGSRTRKLERFRVRPGYKSQDLLVEFCGYHRARGFPDVAGILEHALHARFKRHPTLDTVAIAVATDEIITLWEYEHGEFEVDDDWGGLFILAPKNNAQVVGDIERVLLQSGFFAKEEVNFATYGS